MCYTTADRYRTKPLGRNKERRADSIPDRRNRAPTTRQSAPAKGRSSSRSRPKAGRAATARAAQVAATISLQPAIRLRPMAKGAKTSSELGSQLFHNEFRSRCVSDQGPMEILRTSCFYLARHLLVSARFAHKRAELTIQGRFVLFMVGFLLPRYELGHCNLVVLDRRMRGDGVSASSSQRAATARRAFIFCPRGDGGNWDC